MSRVSSCVRVLSVLMAIANASAAPSEIQYLSGTDKDNTVPWEFRVSGGRNSGFWTNIAVPSCWETMDFGTYEYGNVSTTEFGEYRCNFQVPADWSGKRVFLVFESSMTDTETKINGIAPGTSPSSGSLNPLPNDRAFDNSASTAGINNGGIARPAGAGNVNLGTRSQFTFTCWVKTAADFSTSFPRLMLVGSTNYDSTAGQTGAFLTVYNSGGTVNALQFKINGDTGSGALSSPNILSGTDWVFIAVTYDSTLPNGNVKFYVGDKNLALGAPVSTVTYPSNSVNFGTSAFAYLLNRNTNNRNRAFDGWGDDFRIYNGVLDQATLDAVRASAVDSTNASPAGGLLYQWSFNTAVSGTTVTPDVGAGGVLTLYNSANSPADLYTAVGGGVSGGASVSSFAFHQGGFYEFKYEVTSNLVFGTSGTNLLEVKVSKVSADASVNDAERTADYWVFGGIYRPVYLEARPYANIERMGVDAKAGGQITVTAFLSGITNNYTVAAQVTDSNNVAFGGEFSAPVSVGAVNVILSASLPAPNPWSAEFPNLYTLTVELRDGATVVHTVTNTIGFRTVTFTNNVGFFVNGRKVLMRGVCRHELWPTTGRTTSRAISIADIQLMKDMNMNAVRMSHYPPAKHFLEECDRLGLYVLDELAGWQGDYDTGIGAVLVREMVFRDMNHPSIFAWANGNEGGANPNLDGGAGGSTNYYGLYDIQNRPVIRPVQGSGAFNGVITDHYENYNSVTNFLVPGNPVFMPTEELHALYDGGGGACLAEIWDAFQHSANGGGMFIWALIDEGLTNLQNGDIDVKGQAAPDGIVGPFREKEASYYTVKALWSPVQVTAPDPATFAGSLAVENRFDFTSFSQCQFHWQLGWFPDATDPAANFSTNALTGGLLVGTNSGNFAGPALPPGAAGSLVLPSFPPGWTNYDALRLTATDPFGNNIYTWTWPLRTQTQIRDRVLGAVPAGAPTISAGTNASEIIVTNGPRIFRFSKTSGVINSLTVSNQPVSLTNGPRPVAGAAWPVTSITNYSDGTNYIIALNDLTSSANAFQWSIRPDGWVKLTYRYTLTGLQENIGITFDYPSNNVTALNWLGQGPYRVWKNRLAGQEVFTHTKTINNTWTGQDSPYNGWTGTQWVYPEFAGFHGQLYWATLQTTEQPITIATPTTNLFFRVLSPPTTDQANVNPSFPPGAISLLHGISAIGEKFTTAANLSPFAATNVATGLYTGEADFYFGPLPASGSDRDGNGLIDAWEFNYFGDIGQSATADASGDGLSLMLENAFDLSPLVSNANSLRLPRLAAGTSSPVAMDYLVPVSQLDYYSFIPGLTADFQQWFWADAYPSYFTINATPSGLENAFSVEPNLSNWPGDPSHLFLRLKIQKRN